MASRKVVTGTKAVIDALNNVNNNLNKSYFNLALETLCSEAADVARKKLKDTDHRQKYGDQLADEIGYAVVHACYKHTGNACADVLRGVRCRYH